MTPSTRCRCPPRVRRRDAGQRADRARDIDRPEPGAEDQQSDEEVPEIAAADDPDAVIETDSATFSTLIWDGRDLADALRAGDITIDGDHRTMTRFIELFLRPQPSAR